MAKEEYMDAIMNGEVLGQKGSVIWSVWKNFLLALTALKLVAFALHYGMILHAAALDQK